MQCPICQGDMWNNIETKKNPKAPDYRCKDKTCEGVIWPPKDKKPAQTASQAPKSGPKWTWLALGKTYERSLLLAEMRVTACADRLGIKATISDVLQATATIMIEACRSGVSEPAVKLPPKPEPKPEPEEEYELVD